MDPLSNPCFFPWCDLRQVAEIFLSLKGTLALKVAVNLFVNHLFMQPTCEGTLVGSCYLLKEQRQKPAVWVSADNSAKKSGDGSMGRYWSEKAS